MPCIDMFDRLESITDDVASFVVDEAELMILQPDTGRRFDISATDLGEDEARITIECRNLDCVRGCDAFYGDVVIRLYVDLWRQCAVVESTEIDKRINSAPDEACVEAVTEQLDEIRRYRRSPLAFIDRTPERGADHE